MSGPPTGLPPETPAAAVPPSGPPPYGTQPFPPRYYPAPPPRRDNLAVIIVIVVVVVVLVSVVISAILYILVSGLIGPPVPPSPLVVFGLVQMAGGNATIPVASTSREIDSWTLQVRLIANGSGSSKSMPPPNGSVILPAGGYTLAVFWLDQDNDQLFGAGDVLRVTGNLAPLPASTRFALDLLSTGMLAEVIWTTP